MRSFLARDILSQARKARQVRFEFDSKLIAYEDCIGEPALNESTMADIRSFLQERLSFKGDNADLKDSESLFVSGRLDSLDAMETVVFLEENFSIDFGEIGFEQALIDSPEAILALIQEHASPGRLK